jgi:Co/Zn/Cd efflux system component
MSAHCCEDKQGALEALRTRQAGTLKVVLAINVVMFLVEATGGVISSSTALLSDSLDNLGDALTYALSLFVVWRSDHAKARVAVFKGILILVAGLVVVAQIAYRLVVPATPLFETMGTIALVALAANATCLALLWKHRAEDVNMASVFECSRNDIASNLAVIVAAVAVAVLGTGWPDLVVAIALATLFLLSAARVLRRAWSELYAEAGVLRSPSPGPHLVDLSTDRAACTRRPWSPAGGRRAAGARRRAWRSTPAPCVARRRT